MENLVLKMKTELEDMFEDLCGNLLKDNPDLHEICDRYHQSVHVTFQIINDADFMREEYARIKEICEEFDDSSRLQETIVNMVEEYVAIGPRTPMMAICSWYSCTLNDDPEKREIIKLNTPLVIYASIDCLYRQAFLNPGRLDDVMRFAKLSLRHEIGHIKDYLRYVGMDVKEWNEREERDEKKKKEVYKKIDEYQHKMLPQNDIGYACNMMYYNEIPIEKRANEEAGFTPEELELLYNQCNLNC